jgi:hypothetical protein
MTEARARDLTLYGCALVVFGYVGVFFYALFLWLT